jgi:hypothetical protein
MTLAADRGVRARVLDADPLDDVVSLRIEAPDPWWPGG